MNRFMYGLLVAIIVVLSAVLVWKITQKPKVVPGPVVFRLYEDRTKIDSLEKEVWGLNAKIDSSKAVAQKFRKQVITQKKELEGLKAYKDSVEAAYFALKSLERCDSLVEAQRAVINEQDTVLTALEAEAIEYSRQVYLLTDKTDLQDQKIALKDSTIQSLQCAYDWKIQNRFWAWLLGWKCHPP